MLWLADTSVAVPAVVSTHDAHERVNASIGVRALCLPAHAALETYSVLTRLPGTSRVAPADAALLLEDRFERTIALAEPIALALVRELARLDLAGGAVYDALIAVTCRAHNGTLVTRDRRASATYDALGVSYELIPG